MSIARLPVVFTTILLILVVRHRCQACQNAFENFHEILQRQQQPGRLTPSTEIKLSRQPVFTKLECLDICLRTAECGSFDVKQGHSKNGTRTFWACVINRQVNSQGTMPEMIGQNKGWIHFSVSSQDLQEILTSAADAC
ncbi:hypothetical protein ACROYT_G027947 [Oculina patagonica]